MLMHMGTNRCLFILAAIGILVMLVACFNFINLVTARASLKAKEIGIKKVLGSSKFAIITKVLSETFVQCFLALVFSIIILALVTPLLNSLSSLVLLPVDFVKLPVVCVFYCTSICNYFAGWPVSSFGHCQVQTH